VKAAWNVLLGAFLFIAGVRRRRAEDARERIVADAEASPRAELVVAVLLLLAALCSVAFVVFLATDSIGAQVQLEGASLGGAFLFFAAALIVTGNHLVVTEELDGEYPEPESPDDQEAIDQIVRESGSRITRKGLLTASVGTALAALGAALLAPLTSLGPMFKTRELQQAPWRRGRRLVDDKGRPYRADDISVDAFYTAFPEGRRERELIGGPVVVVRVDEASLSLPKSRSGWAPGGIVAYSKICTHAGCAVALYRRPLYPRIHPQRALVCPCHYSTFDPATGAKVLYGPAGRPLPQLPLYVDRDGFLRAGGNLSGPPGPGWWGAQSGPAREV
jgi:ubiquinol-cytochrome c reductase iron-sulfur subunit